MTLLRGSVAMLALLASAGCGSDDELGFQVVDACAPVEQASEQVFRTEAEWETFLLSHGAIRVPDVDFTQRMVASRFDGGGSACTRLTVENVLETEGRVTIEATRHLYDGPCVLLLAFPQVSVSVEQRDLPVEWQITSVTTSNQPQGRSCP
jgi:hypothetical protein